MTPEPCLNCTCKKGVLLCFLRVCPSLVIPLQENCVTIREPGHCCPVVRCPTASLQTTTPLFGETTESRIDQTTGKLTSKKTIN